MEINVLELAINGIAGTVSIWLMLTYKFKYNDLIKKVDSLEADLAAQKDVLRQILQLLKSKR